ncbi:MAG: YraN family protein [bacterium]|nr:YraN family protein [bacterium]
MDKKSLGAKGETIAVSLLRRQGYKILERNFHSRFGEIDIVAQDADTLVFVEVKTRWSKEFGLPEESVGARKLKSIEKVGQYFRLLHPEVPSSERIDVVAIELDNSGKIIRRELIKNVSG